MIHETFISEADQNVIKDIVASFPSGERVRALRTIFKHDCTTEHFLFLGIVIGGLVRNDSAQIHKMKILSYQN